MAIKRCVVKPHFSHTKVTCEFKYVYIKIIKIVFQIMIIAFTQYTVGTYHSNMILKYVFKRTHDNFIVNEWILSIHGFIYRFRL